MRVGGVQEEVEVHACRAPCNSPLKVLGEQRRNREREDSGEQGSSNAIRSLEIESTVQFSLGSL